MNCPESHDLLQKRLDGHVEGDRTALGGHLVNCPECRERHAVAQLMVDGLGRLDAPVVPGGLRDRIVGQILAERRATVHSRFLWRAAVAAGLLLAALAGYQGYRAGWFGTSDTPLAALRKAKKSALTVVHKNGEGSSATASLGQTFEDASRTALALTRRTAGETLAQARRWLPQGPLALPASPFGEGGTLAPVLDPPAQSLRQAGQSVTAGLKPVASSARRALDLFLQQLPPMASDS